MAKTYSSSPSGSPGVMVACPLCGSRSSAPRLACEGFAFVRCRSCGLVYQNPRPSPGELRHRYDEAYFAYELANEQNFFDLMRLGLADVAFDRLAASLAAPRTFLDVGCATGMLIAWLRDRGWDAEGVDVCRESAEHGRRERGVRIHVGTLEEVRFAPGSFAVVHFSHLIEHLPDPRGFLAEVRRVLRDDGFMLVTTPNIGGLQARLFAARWRSAIADHVVLFTRATLRRILAQSGFRVLQMVTWGGLAAGTAPAWLKRPADRLAKRWGFGDVMLALCRPGVSARS